VVLDLPRPGPWDIRVRRITPDSTSQKLMNDLYWESYTEIIDAKVNYTLTHAVGIIIDAEQFGSVPKRTYLVDGRLLQIPVNYDPDARSYDGVWDGTFTTDWTNNPAWCLYDLAINARYGIGAFLEAADIDKWALYEIAQWCDELVPDGHGGSEPRFVCNMVIRDRREAYDWIATLCSVFRGFSYWNGGQLVAVADQPRPVTGIYTAANVIGGRFNYASADLRAMHNMAVATWADADNLGEVRFSIAEDQEAISRYGILDVQTSAAGASSEGQALRVAKWTLFTENYEAEVVAFAVSLDGAWCKPGDVVAVADKVIGGERRGGRVVNATQSIVTLDGPVTVTVGQTAFLSCIVGEGEVETLRVTGIEIVGEWAVVTVFGAFSVAPAPNAPWVLASGDLETTLWRVMTISEDEDGTYTVNAVKHRPDKWAVVEQNLPISQPDTSNIEVIPPPVTNLVVNESLIRTAVGGVGVLAQLSWTSRALMFDVDARPDLGNWVRTRVQTTAADIAVTEGWWNFQVTPISGVGRKGVTATIRKEIIGRYAPPGPPVQFRIVVNQGMALFRWLPATEIDVIIGGRYELRFIPRTTGEIRWQDGQTIIASIPGNSTSCEAVYQPGTYMLRTFDAVGVASETFALVIVTTPDTAYVPYLQICESPTWLGTMDNTEVDPGNDWLVIAGDDAGGTGTYTFDQSLDLGGVFATRLSWDMLAFPYFPGDETIASRLDLVDTWESWDNATGDLHGTVEIQMRQTDIDPAIGGWGPWKAFTAGEHVGRGFEFRVILEAPPGQNIGIERLCILADIRNKIDEDGDVPYVPDTEDSLPQTVMFNIEFFEAPAVTITIQEALAGDHVVLSNKSNESFDIEILNSSGVQVARTFDWHAMGI
jgi:hypothetical protein